MTKLSIRGCLEYWATRKPDASALITPTHTVTWSELDRRSNRLARVYASLGVVQDDMVVIGLPNGAEFYFALFAIWKLGALPLPISWRITETERCEMIALAKPRLAVGIEDMDGVRCVPANFCPDPEVADTPLPDRVPRYWKAVGSGGSTGRPKIVVSTDLGLFDPHEPRFGMEVGGTILVAGPLYHNASLIFSSLGLFCGNATVVMNRFDAARALELIEQYGVTWVCLVPTMMKRIWDLPEERRVNSDISSLKIVLHTAAACPAWLKEKWIGWVGEHVLLEGYGGTEGNGSTFISGTEWLERPGSVGKPGPGSEVRIVDEQDRKLPQGVVGNIQLRFEAGHKSAYFYSGSEPYRTRDGWEWLGDMGYLDEDGYLYVADRRTDMIVSGGANVYPAEVEAAIDAFPGVRSNAVIGLPDDDLGHSVHAVIDAPEGIDLGKLRDHLSARLTRYKIPRSFDFVDSPVRDDAGKVRRGFLRQQRIRQQ